MADDVNDDAKRAAWDAALHSFGTAAIFERRARGLKRWLNALKVLGIVLPVLLGGTVATFGAKWQYLEYAVILTSLVGLVQLGASAVALAMGWDDAYANAKEAQAHNTRLSDDYRKVAEKLNKADDSNRPLLIQRIDLLDVERALREQLDQKANISADEKRFGLRAALHQFQRKCITCAQIPDPRVPSDCTTCGK